MMLQLKATKTSLYNLVASHEPLPEIRKTEFIKAYRTRAWWMKWYDENASFAAFFAPCAGRASLSIEKYSDEIDEIRTSREVYYISVDELRVRGMIEEKE